MIAVRKDVVGSLGLNANEGALRSTYVSHHFAFVELLGDLFVDLVQLSPFLGLDVVSTGAKTIKKP